MDILAEARDVLQQEAKGIENLIPTLDQNFVNAVHMIMESKGRTIVTGMGKSGHIARKVSATLSSTGTPSIFLHPAEGIHGDLGMVTGDDVVLAFSNSGETVEILNILPSLKRIGATITTRRWLKIPTSSSTHPSKRKPAPWAWRRRRARPWP